MVHSLPNCAAPVQCIFTALYRFKLKKSIGQGEKGEKPTLIPAQLQHRLKPSARQVARFPVELAPFWPAAKRDDRKSVAHPSPALSELRESLSPATVS